MIGLRHFLHPIRSTTSLWQRALRHMYTQLVDKQLRDIRRDYRDLCWCGGQLIPFKWHSSYGICINCGSYVNQCPPSRDEIKKIYSSDCYWGTVSKMRGWPTLKDRSALYRADGRVYHWLKIVEKYGPSKGDIVEVGCAPGVLLSELQGRGFRCLGIEAEEKVAEWIHTNMNIDVRIMLFPDPIAQLPKCDIFLAFDVLEHVPSPVDFLKQAASLLKPGGIAIIQTPIDRYDYDPPFGYEVPVVFSDIEHLFIFVDKAMVMMGEKVGLEVVSLSDKPWRLGHEICVYKKSESIGN